MPWFILLNRGVRFLASGRARWGIYVCVCALFTLMCFSPRRWTAHMIFHIAEIPIPVWEKICVHPNENLLLIHTGKIVLSQDAIAQLDYMLLIV